MLSTADEDIEEIPAMLSTADEGIDDLLVILCTADRSISDIQLYLLLMGALVTWRLLLMGHA